LTSYLNMEKWWWCHDFDMGHYHESQHVSRVASVTCGVMRETGLVWKAKRSLCLWLRSRPMNLNVVKSYPFMGGGRLEVYIEGMRKVSKDEIIIGVFEDKTYSGVSTTRYHRWQRYLWMKLDWKIGETKSRLWILVVASCQMYNRSRTWVICFMQVRYTNMIRFFVIQVPISIGPRVVLKGNFGWGDRYSVEEEP